MKIRFSVFPFLLILALSLLNTGMARKGQYDEEARQAEKEARLAQKAAKEARPNPVKRFASGIKEATVDSTAGFISETADSTRKNAPVKGTLEGASKGTEKMLDSTVKGASKIAMLGFGEVTNYDVEQPEANTDQTTKIKIKIPGT